MITSTAAPMVKLLTELCLPMNLTISNTLIYPFSANILRNLAARNGPDHSTNVSQGAKQRELLQRKTPNQ